MALRLSRRRREQTDDGPRASFRDLVPYLMEHRRALVLAIAVSLVTAAASLAQPALVAELVNRIGLGAPLAWPATILITLVVVGSALGAWQHYLLQRTGTAVVLSSRRKLIAQLLRLPIREFDQRRTGDLVSRVGTDTTLLYAVLTQGLVDSFAGLLIIVGALIAMLVIDPLMLATIVGVLIGAAGITLIFFGRIRRASAEQQDRVGELSSKVERVVSAIRTVRAAGAEGRERESLDATAHAAYRAGVQVARASALVVPLAGLALQLAIIIVLGVGGIRLANGSIDPAQLVAFVMFLFIMIVPMATLLGAVTSVSEALGALGRIEEVLRLDAEDAHDSVRTDRVASATPAIELDAVSFRYPGADASRPVLDEVSCVIPVGARVAIVGPSGAGKSTILALLERFYDPCNGSIRLHGTDLRDLPRAAVRAQFGYVEQDAPTLAGTLADNLRLAAPSATDDACERVLREVNLGSVIDRSPAGINTVVGEDGVLLSGGERQRLAVARTLLQDAPILLLDESTSSLDGRNEHLMREAIERASTDRTVIVIAHRLATVIDSDVIVVLDEGRVIGYGTHAELVDSVPLYRELAARQLLVASDGSRWTDGGS